MIQIEKKATLLSAESKPYDFNGNSGVSHRVRVLIGGDVFSCKSTADQVLSLTSFVGMEGTAQLGINSRKEALSLDLIDFK